MTIGAALGTLASLGVSHLVAAQLFGVTPRDIRTVTLTFDTFRRILSYIEG